jgi:hypothetical protein
MSLEVKTQNTKHQAYKVIIYTDNQNENAIEFYEAKTYFSSVNLYGETYQSESDYLTLEIDNLKIVRNNPTHINASKRRKDLFILASNDYQQTALYIPRSALKDLSVEERKTEDRKGCLSVHYDSLLTFGENIKVKTITAKAYFAKPTDQADKNHREEIKRIDDEIEKTRSHMSFFKGEKHRQARERYLALLEEKKRAGFEYLVYQYGSVEVTTDNLRLFGYVDHYEKSAEYIKAEKLTKELQTINERWTIYNTLDLLERYKLTKKRSAKK